MHSFLLSLVWAGTLAAASPAFAIATAQTGAAPEPTASSVVLHRDDFNRPTASIRQGYASRSGDAITAVSAAPLAGTAVRFSYSASAQDVLLEFAHPPATDVYIRFDYRTSRGADPTAGGSTGSGMKWLLAWREANAPRYTFGVGNLGKGNAGLEFTAHDNGSTAQPNPVLQNKTKALRFGTTNDGAWHRYTLHIVTGTNGYEEIWIDGTLVLSDRGAGYDHDPHGVSLWQFPGDVVDGVKSPFTIDITHLVVWKNP